MKRFGCVFLAGLLVIQPVLAQNKPTIIVSPLRGKNTKPAMDAISSEFRKSNQVYVIEFEKIMEYVDSKKSGKERKSTKEALEEFEKGKKAYQDLNIKEAIRSLEKAKTLYQDALWDESSFEGLRSTKFNLAMAYLADKKDAQAKQELQEMILIDPRRDQTNPSEKYYSPQIRQLYQKVLRDMQSADVGDLHIQTTPANAVVFMDGVSQGNTPFDLKDIPVGKHYFRLVPKGETSGEMIEKVIVSGLNEIEQVFPETKSTDSYSFFQTTGGQRELDQTRATYLDEMGLALGADIFVFLTPLQGKVKGQLYDQRSQELSPEISETSPQTLVSKLIRFLGDDGYVIRSEQGSASMADIDENLQTGNESSVQLKPRSTPSSQKSSIDYTQAQSEMVSPSQKTWYQNKWVWIGLGAGLVAAGAGLYFFGAFDFGSSASTVKATIP